jgi:hypothetical protein
MGSLWRRTAMSVAPPKAKKHDGTTEAALARSLSALLPEERGWITFAEARILFSTKGTQYAFGETAPERQKKHRVVRDAAPVRHKLHAGKGRVYFVGYPTAATSIA